ncbi:MAG: amino acid deaminase [Sphingobium sp.]
MTLWLKPIIDSTLDGLTKGIPAQADLALGEVGEQGWRLLQGDIPLPAAVLLRSAIDHNIAWMRAFTEMTGIRLCPHGKTSMSPQLFDLQLRAGAWGITAATVSHLHVYRRFGVQRILLANQLIDPGGIRFVLSELDRDPSFDFYCLVDSIESVRILENSIAEHGCSRPLQVLLEVGQQAGRTGARSVDDAIAVAQAVNAASPALALRGIEGFEGVLEGASAETTLARIDRLFADMLAVAQICDRKGLFAEMDDGIILSAGGSQYFDLPLKLRSFESLSQRSSFVLRSGCYVTHDSSWFRDYAEAIAIRMPEINQLGPGLRPAIEVWAHVQSLPEPGLAIVAMGKRDCSFDVHMPTPIKWCKASSDVPQTLSGHHVAKLNDHHCYLDLPENSPLSVGDKVGFGIAHPCTTFDRWEVMLTVDDTYAINGAVKTFF